MIVRVTDTAIDPEDLARCTEVVRDKVKPAFDSLPGCRGIEIHVRVDERHGDLIEVAAVSRWDSVEAMESAVRSEQYAEAMSDARRLFHQAPIVRIFEVAE
ncbi:MAG: antibiotic biosynthesis monooxygenase [Actinomycetota bacterium]|nr:antibiotic biosynthesis monooxygenase [Actinomycetota bacterium]